MLGFQILNQPAPNMNSSTKGFSLIEVLLIMGVILVLLTAAFVIFPKVSKIRQAEDARQALNTAPRPTKADTQSTPIETSKTSSCKKNEENCIREYGE